MGNEDSSAACESLREEGVAVTEPDIDDPDRIPEMIRQQAHEYDLVILGGGDGTINSAAPALIETGVPLGILPMGTANDLARTLLIPQDMTAACDIIASGTLHAIDVGEVNGHPFFNTAGMGLSSAVTKTISNATKSRWGIFAYAGAMLDAYKRQRPFEATVETEDRCLRMQSLQLTIANGRYYGGGMTAAADAAIDDGTFDVFSLEPVGLMQLVAMAPWFRAGLHERWDAVQVLHAHEIRVRTNRPLPICADGEMVSHTPAHFRLRRGALRVFVPDEYLATRDEGGSDAPQ